MAKVKFYYLPDFYNVKSDGKIGGYRDKDDNDVEVSVLLSPTYAASGDTVIIAPASKRQLAKADAELLAIIKEEGNKKL
jgi:hypothetical protein